MMVKDGIDIIIPSCEAVQMARRMKISPEKSLTEDGRHIRIGAGRYLLACTWYEALIAPVFGVGVVGNTERHFDGGTIADDIAEKCQWCAAESVLRWRNRVKREGGQ